MAFTAPAATCNDRAGGHILQSASTRDALIRRKWGTVLHEIDQKLERPLRLWLDQLQLRKTPVERLDVIAVLDFVQTVRRSSVIVLAIRMRQGDTSGVGASMAIDG